MCECFGPVRFRHSKYPSLLLLNGSIIIFPQECQYFAGYALRGAVGWREGPYADDRSNLEVEKSITQPAKGDSGGDVPNATVRWESL